VLTLTATLAASLVGAGPALADGDPASDVLATQSLFLPQDASVSPAYQGQLLALLEAARRAGLQLRLAIVASPTDLGSVGVLWRQPQAYAKFLDQELSQVYPGTLLVVMPNGLGVQGGGPSTPVARAAITGLPPPGSVAGLGVTTLTAVRRIAAADGHPLSVPGAVAPGTASSSGTDVIAWLVFAVGAAAIVLAWTLSLRARPFQATSASDPDAGHGSTSV
jgi:hypothetical protein